MSYPRLLPALALLAACADPDGGLTKFNNDPVATITSHVDGDEVGEGYVVTLRGTIADDNDAAADLVATWYAGADELCATAPVASDGTTLCEVVLDAGETEVVLEGQDDDNASGTARVTLVVNATEAPTATILAPDGVGPYYADQPVTVEAVVADAEDAADALVVAWTDGTGAALALATTPDGDGALTDELLLDEGDHTLVLTVTDLTGKTGTASVDLTVGPASTSLPDVTIDLPLDGDVVNEGEVVTFLATVSDDRDAPDTLSLAWESDVDGLLDVSAADAAGAAGFDTSDLSVGEHVVTLTAVDGDGLVGEASITLSVNGLPGAPTLVITPASPTGADDLVAAVTAGGVDPEGDTLSYTWAWTVDGAATALTGATVPASATNRGEVWEVTATPNDGRGDGAPGTATVTIGNSAPVLADAMLAPDPAVEGDTLACAPGAASDADGDAIVYTYTWQVNGLSVAASGSALGDTWWARGDTVACVVTPDDGTDAGAAVTSNTVTIDNSAPSITSVSVTPTSPTAGDTLTCAAAGFSDADGDADATTYTWTLDGVTIGTGATLAGGFAGGDTITCTATPSDGTVDGTARSASVTVVNSAPVLASVALTPASPTEADTLTCTPGAVTDADGTTTFTYTWSWTVGGAVIAATGSTLDGADFDRGDAVRCRVIPNDGTEDGAMVASAAVTVLNTAPVVSAVTLSSTAPDTDDTLSVTVTSSDADGDAVSYTYAWYVDGAVAGTSATLSGASFDAGDTVYVVVTPSDGTDTGAAFTSATATVANTAPVLASVTLTPTTAYEASTLTCTPSASDADGDSVSYTYAWYVDGAAVAATSSTLTGTDFSKGDVVYCRATPSDGTTSGTAMSSSAVTIANTAPTLTSASLTPTTAYEASTLTCSPSGGADADGDSLSYTYAWYVNGAAVAATSSTLTGTYFSKSGTVYCRVTPTDGTTSGTAVTSATVTISNTAPTTASVSLTPTTAYEGSTLTCAPSSSDADGDSVSHTYAWYVNGSAVAATSSTLTGTYFSKSGTVYCRATPTDGTTSGSAVSSNTVTISNSTPSAPTVVITPDDPEEGADDLVCEIDTSATDADGDALTYTFTWTVDGVSYTGASSTSSSSTVPAAATTADDVWVCSATATDGSATSGAGTDTIDVMGASYTIGYSTTFSSPGTGYASANYHLGQQVTVSSAVELYQLGLLLRLADTDSVRMALYTDSGGSPGTLVAYTALTSLSGYADGAAVELDVVGAPVSVAAGTYWITYNLSGNAYLGYTTSGASSNTIKYASLSSSSAFPSSFGTASSYTGQFINLYMVVR